MEDDANFSLKKWKQRQVKIKTLEGDFSVMLWTNSSGEDETSEDHEQAKFEDFNLENIEKKIVCPYEGCNKMFRNKHTLHKHQHCHGPREHICATCGKGFTENSKLKRHQLVHSGEKPFVCSYNGCGKRFSLDFNLRTHIKIHTNIRPFVCTFSGCQKAFIQSNNLKSHLVTHYLKQQRNKINKN